MYINQNYYPDMLRRAYIVNVPSFFNFFWKGISLWMEPRTLAKLELIYAGQDISQELVKVIDPTQLPACYGGTLDRSIPQGGPIGAIPVQLSSKSTRGYVEVPRSGTWEEVYKFNEGDIISWEFRTQTYDIAFSVYLMNGDEKQEVVPSQRYEAFKRVVTGSYAVETTGEYHFCWDNTYSWTRGKQVEFNIYRGTEVISNNNNNSQ